MRIKRIFVLVSTISLPLESQEAEHFAVHRAWTLDGAGGQEFLSVMGMAPTADGSVLVSDKLANALLCIDSNGHVRQKLQRKGKTAGSLNGPGLVAVTDTLVAVADFASQRIQLLTTHFTPVSEIRAVGPVFSLAFDGEGCLWVGALRAIGGETLFRYSRDGRELLRRKSQASRGNMFDDMFHVTSSGSKVYLVYITRNILEQWDTLGRPLGVTTVSGFPPRVLPASAAAQERGVPPGVLFASCATDQKGRVHVLAGDGALHPRRDVFGISESGEIISVVTLPERSAGIRIDTHGRILAIENRKTRLSCYTLKKAR